MYRELIGNFIKDHNWAKLQEPCPESEITRAEVYVGFTFPEELKALLRETNGDHWFLLSAQEMIDHVKTNREIFPEYLDRKSLKKKLIVMCTSQQMVAVIITAIVYFQMTKRRFSYLYLGT